MFVLCEGESMKFEEEFKKLHKKMMKSIDWEITNFLNRVLIILPETDKDHVLSF